jgi:hypothetical protein
MSDTILGGDFTVYYEAENRQKRIVWSGAATGTRTANELYSALQDLFDELNQLDDGTPMSAQTPTEYTIGIIDTGDDDPWFIDDTTVEHITGGAITTSGWTRNTGTATGIVKIEYTVTTGFAGSDIGKTVTNATGGDSGTLLFYNETGATKYAWIRPDTDAAANDWDSTSGQIDVTGGTTNVGTQSAAAIDGESLWANIFTLGTIEANTHIYVKQDGALLTAAEASTDWWADGQIDILVKVKGEDVEIDEGVVQVFARQATKSYSFFNTDLTNGGRNPIPLQTGDDLSNPNGDRQMVLTVTNDAWVVDEVMTDDSDSTIQGVVTSYDAGTNTLQYYLIGDPLTDFSAGTGTFSGSGTGTGEAVNSTAVNGGVAGGITVTHGSNETFDVDENDTTENYSIVVDCNNNALSLVYERLQFLTRRGESSTGATDGIEGQFYLGSDYRLIYNAETGSVTEGSVVTQVSTGATGTVVAHNTTDNILILRNSRGTFNTTNNVELDGSNYVTMTGGSATPITPISAAPFGTFLGGVFFGAPGVVLDNVPAADATNYQLVDDNGNVVNPPNKVPVAVTNTRALDRIAVFRLLTAGGLINKDQFGGCTAHSIGDATLLCGSAIDVDTPGKTTGGVLRIVDDDLDTEYRIRYSSWSGSTFTLANSTSTATAGTSDTALVDTVLNLTTAAKVGDIVTTAAKGYSYITSITDADNAVMAGGTLSGFVSTDAYEINAIPVATTTSDNVYVPLLDVFETTGTDASPGNESTTLTYNADIDARVVARNATAETETTIPMLPYTADVTVTSNGLSNAVIRTKDRIKT